MQQTKEPFLGNQHCTIKVQHRNMLEKTQTSAVSVKDGAACFSVAGKCAKFCKIKCNEANLHNPESYSMQSTCEGWCCIFLDN